MKRRNTRSTRRQARRNRTVAGRPASTQDTNVQKIAAKAITSTPYVPLAPVSDEVTVYGAKKFRNPAFRNEFVGTQGSPQEAVVLDIDGTITEWGASANKETIAWTRKHVEKGRVVLVVTAREHEFSFTSSFNQLLRLLPFPFIGPFCRANDDPRYASEFKRELVQGLVDAGLYRIMGAADDNTFVNDMWKQWAIEHFENPDDFDLLECKFRSYSSWRNDLPPRTSGSSHVVGYTGMGSKVGTATTVKPYVPTAKTPTVVKPPAAKKWVEGGWDAEGHWVAGYWSSAVSKSTPDEVVAEVTWQEYVDNRPGEPVEDDDWTNDGYTLLRRDLINDVSRTSPDLSRNEIEGLSNESLWELAGYDYRQDLLDGVTEKYRENDISVFTKDELELLCNDDLEELLMPHVSLTDGKEYVTMLAEARHDYDEWERHNATVTQASVPGGQL